MTIIFRALLLGFFIAFIGLAGCQSEAVPSADLILYNANVYTVDEEKPWAEAVAIKDGKIVYVGNDKDVQNWVDGNTVQQNLNGKMLLPGFIDSHAHLIMGGAYVRSLSLDTYATPALWLAQIKQFSEDNPDASHLLGYGFLASAFGPQGPTAEMLDSIVSDRPVFIWDEGFHGGWVNTKAMQLLNLTKDTADPTPGFSYYKRDNEGNPSGYLLEVTASMAVADLNLITPESIALGASDIINIMNSYGITSVFDASALELEDHLFAILDELVAKNQMTVRLVGSLFFAEDKNLDEMIEQIGQAKADSQTKPYKITTVKIMNDGTVEGKTAGVFEAYQGEPDNKGETVFSQQQMNTMIEQLTVNEIDIHIHALGDRAIHETLNAIELAKNKYPNSNPIITICHVQIITDEDIERMAALGVIAQSTPLWASYDEYGKAFVSTDQFSRFFRFNSLNDADITLSFGSDYPATGAGTLGMSPLFNIEIGHTRQNAGEENGPIQPNINERLDLASLVHGYTIGGAKQLGMESSIGSITVGKKADMVVLEKNLFETQVHSIHQIKVLQTFLGGQKIYQASK
ncbi:MAG: putative amidohydrolase YtcJ [Pseudomonadales bacterium]|jgi:predicted amidohydrolase YtcJ